MPHILRTEEGEPIDITTVYGLPQGCPSAPWAFSMAMATLDEDFYRVLVESPVGTQHVQLERYMDEITLVAAPRVADACFEALGRTLIEAGMKLAEDR